MSNVLEANLTPEVYFAQKLAELQQNVPSTTLSIAQGAPKFAAFFALLAPCLDAEDASKMKAKAAFFSQMPVRNTQCSIGFVLQEAERLLCRYAPNKVRISGYHATEVLYVKDLFKLGTDFYAAAQTRRALLESVGEKFDGWCHQVGNEPEPLLENTLLKLIKQALEA